MRISIVIPALNEEQCLGALLSRLHGAEIILVDGGSTDRTLKIARSHNVGIVQGKPCRGAQLHAGALAATGDVLWFLHADALPSPRSIFAIREVLADPSISGGYFRVCFGEATPEARFLNRFYSGIRKLGLVYGDAGIFVRRECYQAVGGFLDQPLFEDLDFINRLRARGRVSALDCALVASPRRWARKGFARTFTQWVGLQTLYWAGVSPHSLARHYAQERGNATGPHPQPDCLPSHRAS